jgi:RNA polymerase sigma-70 factor (ECF subfamily)
MIQTTHWRVYNSVSTHEAQFGTSLREAALSREEVLTPAEMQAPLETEEQVRLIGLVAARRDRQAFALLFRHFAPRLKAFHLRARLGDAAAEELAQETMLALWRKAGSFDPARAGVATWVFTITRNLRIDHARRQRPRSPPPPDEADPSPSAEALSLVREQTARMRGALAALSDEQRRVIELSFFTETPHAAIAKALNVPLGTVKSRIRLALTRLRAVLGE